MRKHTPAPWEARGMTIWPPGKTGLAIATVIHQPNARDNARLIAAAPEMLEALKLAAAQLRHYEPVAPAILAAIAKAEGLS